MNIGVNRKSNGGGVFYAGVVVLARDFGDVVDRTLLVSDVVHGSDAQ